MPKKIIYRTWPHLSDTYSVCAMVAATLILSLLVLVPICSSTDERIAVVDILIEKLLLAFTSKTGKLQVASSTDSQQWGQW